MFVKNERPGGNKIQIGYFSIKVNVTMALPLVSFDRVSLVK